MMSIPEEAWGTSQNRLVKDETIYEYEGRRFSSLDEIKAYIKSRPDTPSIATWEPELEVESEHSYYEAHGVRFPDKDAFDRYVSHLPGAYKGIDNRLYVPIHRVRRITGYLVGDIRRWNDAKTCELRDRVKHMGNNAGMDANH